MTNNIIDIEETEYTPAILVNTEDGLIEIRGNSLPENTFEFYKGLMDELAKYFEDPKKITTVNMEIIYFNSSSSKLFFDFFDLLVENNDKSNIIINWIFDEENESMEEAGEEFQEDFENLNINLIQK
jgi:hypothetical protein